MSFNSLSKDPCNQLRSQVLLNMIPNSFTNNPTALSSEDDLPKKLARRKPGISKEGERKRGYTDCHKGSGTKLWNKETTVHLNKDLRDSWSESTKNHMHGHTTLQRSNQSHRRTSLVPKFPSSISIHWKVVCSNQDHK